MSDRLPHDPNCFSFYGGNQNAACQSCMASRRCKAMLISDGFQILGDLVDHLTTELPPGNYRDTTRVKEITKILVSPEPIELSDQERELLGMLTATEQELQDLEI